MAFHTVNLLDSTTPDDNIDITLDSAYYNALEVLDCFSIISVSKYHINFLDKEIVEWDITMEY